MEVRALWFLAGLVLGFLLASKSKWRRIAVMPGGAEIEVMRRAG